MTIKIVAALLVACASLVIAGPAHAECRNVTRSVMIQGEVRIITVLVCEPSHETPAGESVGDITAPTEPPAGIALCSVAAQWLGEDVEEMCGGADDAVDDVVLTPGLVARALRRVPLPPSELIIQPPDGRTLVNFDTNFYTEERTLFRAVRLLGQRVELRIVADSYTWHFGDGQSVTTSEPGAPYPRLEVTHSYLRTGRFGPSLDTTYVADFRVGGGAWQPVPGSVTIAGPTLSLRAVEATPVLVGYDG